jgi:hypothetical protein
MPSQTESAPSPERKPEAPAAKPRRRHFAAIFITLGALLLIVAIVAVMVQRFDVNPLGAPTPFATPTPSVQPTPTPSPTPAANTYDVGQAFTQVQSFYSDYQQNASTLSKYVTPQLATQLNTGGNSATGVYCSFNVPSSISYQTPIAANDAATVVADESFVNNPDIDVTLTVSLATLLITAISCPQ